MTLVLVVDDSKLARIATSSFIRNARQDWEIITACDGLEATELISGVGPPDLAIVDINMPRMDGWQLVGQLRDRYGEFPICMLSANIQKASHERAASLNCDFLEKPVTQEGIEGYLARFEA